MFKLLCNVGDLKRDYDLLPRTLFLDFGNLWHAAQVHSSGGQLADSKKLIDKLLELKHVSAKNNIQLAVFIKLFPSYKSTFKLVWFLEIFDKFQAKAPRRLAMFYSHN